MKRTQATVLYGYTVRIRLEYRQWAILDPILFWPHNGIRARTRRRFLLSLLDEKAA